MKEQEQGNKRELKVKKTPPINVPLLLSVLCVCSCRMNQGCQRVNFCLLALWVGTGPGVHVLDGLMQSQPGEFDPWFGRPGVLLNSRIRRL